MTQQDLRVIIQYMEDVPAEPGPDGHRAYLAGETYRLPSAKKAAELHPHAKIVAYADGAKYDADNPRTAGAKASTKKAKQPEGQEPAIEVPASE